MGSVITGCMPLDEVFYVGNLPPNVVQLFDLDEGCMPIVPVTEGEISLETYFNRVAGVLAPKALTDKLALNATTTLADEKLFVSGLIYASGGYRFGLNSRIYTNPEDVLNFEVSGVTALTYGQTYLKGANTANPYIYLGSTNNSSHPAYAFAGDTTTGIYRFATGSIAFTGSGTDLMKIYSDGHITLLVAPPDDVSGTNPVLTYDTITHTIEKATLVLHTHTNKTLLDNLSDIGGKLAYLGALVFDSTVYYTSSQIDDIADALGAEIATKSPIGHTHALADLSERNYSSLIGSPDLSSLHSHTNKATLDAIPLHGGASTGYSLQKAAGGGLIWAAFGGTVLSDILYWNAGTLQYTAYATKQSSLIHFYLGSTAPDYTSRLNLDAALWVYSLNGIVNTTLSTTAIAGLNIPHGTAPSAPVNGDMWTTTAGLFVRINGSTIQLGTGVTQAYVDSHLASKTASATLQAPGAGQNGYVVFWDNSALQYDLKAVTGGGNVSNTGTPVDNQLAVWTAATTIEGTTGLTYDGTTHYINGDVNIASGKHYKINAVNLAYGDVGAAATIHNLVDTTNHPVTGLTTGHFMKALSATTYGFAAHGLSYTDVGAAASSHTLEGHTATVTLGKLLKGTGSNTFGWFAMGTGLQVLRVNTGATDLEFVTPPWSVVTPAALTKTNDTNVTLTLGGTPTTALLQAVSLTLGWTGTLADARITSAATWNAKGNVSTQGSITANMLAQWYDSTHVQSFALGTTLQLLRTNAGVTGVEWWTANYLTANQSITLSSDVTGTGTTAITTTIANNAVSNAKFRQSAGLSVVGVTGAATANVADITGAASTVLFVNSGATALAFVSLANAFGSQTANYVYAAPNGSSGNPTFRALVTADMIIGSGGGTNNFLRADGTWATPAGGGNVSSSGSPVDNQLAVWVSSSVIEGTSGLTYDGSTFYAGGDINILSGKHYKINGSVLLYSDVGAPPLSHAANASTYGYGDATNAGHLRVGTGLGVTTGTISVTYGTGAGTACIGNDARLSDARTPLSHTLEGHTATVTLGKLLKGTGSNTFGWMAIGSPYQVLRTNAYSDLEWHTLTYSDVDSGVGLTPTPTANQLAIWDSSSTIKGDANLTWASSILTIGAGNGTLIKSAGASNIGAYFNYSIGNYTIIGGNSTFYTGFTLAKLLQLGDGAAAANVQARVHIVAYQNTTNTFLSSIEFSNIQNSTTDAAKRIANISVYTGVTATNYGQMVFLLASNGTMGAALKIDESKQLIVYNNILPNTTGTYWIGSPTYLFSDAFLLGRVREHVKALDRYLNTSAQIHDQSSELPIYTYTLGHTGNTIETCFSSNFNNILRVTLAGHFNIASTAQTITLKIKYGATTLFGDISASLDVANNYPFRLEFMFFNEGVETAQRVVGTFFVGKAISGSVAGYGQIEDIEVDTPTDMIDGTFFGTSAENSFLDKDLVVSIKFSGSHNDWFTKMAITEII